MEAFNIWTRRKFISTASVAALSSAAFAEELTKTPRQAEGPFYPDKLPLDTDNDLLIVNDNVDHSVGEITHLGGRILDHRGDPIRNALVEIWQVDNQGIYIHTGDKRGTPDKNFQGFGRFLTGSSGEYYFRTIKPKPFGGRPAHVHYAVYRNNKRELTTQCYVSGDERLKKDRLFKRSGKLEGNPLVVDFKPIKNSKLGELNAIFDVVLGS